MGEDRTPRDKRSGKKAAKRPKKETSAWKILRIKRRIKAGYYNRPEVRSEIVDTLLDALMDG